ncbi:LysR substrate-binding domain-containing protein [uncultured Aquitalea sp.]|uniref:LysR substrate-binding domain-containing protein n=1 Tax=uncultured Aquitalea sp. TaxID=540272 RepID=UPI0025E6AE28|nr:LysR substrate-binding domain-containing protein [uncultured Aquitalea sp.]
MKALPPLAALRSFEAVARLGGITRAAEELHVTHSAISQQIRLLEDMLGLPLFVREGRGLRVTEEGRFYALQVRSGLGELSEATRLIQARPRESDLALAVLPSFGAQWLLPRLHRFQALYPRYRVSIRASLDIQDLRQGLVDVGIRIGQGDWEGLRQLKLFDDELLMVASPAFNGGRLPKTPQEIMAGPLIRSVESWQPWCQLAGIDEPGEASMWINDSNLILGMVRQGLGITLERRSLVQRDLDSGQLVRLTDIVAPYPYPCWLVWPVRESARAKQEVFTSWLQGEVADYLADLRRADGLAG